MDGILARSNRGQRAAVKRTGQGDDAYALALATAVVITPHHLEAGFHGFGAGIAEEHAVGKGVVHQTLGQSLGLRDTEQIGAVPDARGLLLQRLHQMRMAMSQAVHGDASGEIQIALACRRIKPGALAALEFEVRVAVIAHQCGNHATILFKSSVGLMA